VCPKHKNHVGSVVTVSGECITCPADIVNSFNDRFLQLFRSFPPAQICIPDFTCSCSFHFTSVTVEAVLDVLNSLIVTKATGPDGLPARILKLAAPMIAGSLATLFNVCLTEGVFPTNWKLANVHPVYKSGDSHLLTNWPISVLSILAKVFETIVHQQVYSHFSSNDLLHSAQSAFHPGHSTQDILIKATMFH